MEIPSAEIRSKISQISGDIERISDLERISRQEIERSYRTINDLTYTNISGVELIKWLLTQEQNIYTTLNKLKMGDRIF